MAVPASSEMPVKYMVTPDMDVGCWMRVPAPHVSGSRADRRIPAGERRRRTIRAENRNRLQKERVTRRGNC
jgi:hypothetical protein